MSSQADVEAELARLKGAQRRAGSPEAIEAAPEPGEILADEPEKQESAHRAPASKDAPVVIIRILGEGQYDVADHALDRAQRARRRRSRPPSRPGDQAAFATALAGLLDGVRTAGVAHPADSLDESDLILPAADATIDEVRAAARRRRPDPGLGTPAPLGAPRQTGAMARTRFVDDAGLTARMTMVMFLLGAPVRRRWSSGSRSPSRGGLGILIGVAASASRSTSGTTPTRSRCGRCGPAR